MLSSRSIAAVIAVTLATSLAGCTAGSPTADPTAAPTAASGPSRDAVLEELGEFPADTPWSDAERAQSLAATADSYWAQASVNFPSLERPIVEAVSEIEPDEALVHFATCLEDGGVNLTGTSAGELVPRTEAETLIWYTCRAAYPTVPRPPINDAQLGYLYDYLTLFVAPCLEAHGETIPDAPARDSFIELWPNQNWFPTPDFARDEDEAAAHNEACPSTVGAY